MEPNEDPTAATPDPAESATPDPAESATPEPDAAAAGKPDTVKRFLAMLIDGILASVVTQFIPFIGWLIGAAYMVVRDGLDIDFMKGRSLGKKIMKLRLVRLDEKPMDLEASFKRNWMWGIGCLAAIPIIGWLAAPFILLAALIISLYECYKVLTDKEGRRWGDVLAGTRVIESES